MHIDYALNAGTYSIPVGMHAGGAIHQKHNARKAFGLKAYTVQAGLCLGAVHGDPFAAIAAADLSGGLIDAVFCVGLANVEGCF